MPFGNKSNEPKKPETPEDRRIADLKQDIDDTKDEIEREKIKKLQKAIDAPDEPKKEASSTLGDEVKSYLNSLYAPPTDEELHKWAEGKNLNVHEVETEIYKLAYEHLKESTKDVVESLISIAMKSH